MTPPRAPLDYAVDRTPRDPSGRFVVAFILTLFLSIGHMWYAFAVPNWLSRLGFKFSGDPKWVWAIPIHLTAVLPSRIAPRIRDTLGFDVDEMLLLATTVWAAACAASLVVAALWRDRRIFGRYKWRLWCLLMGWGWIAVPARLSMIYMVG